MNSSSARIEKRKGVRPARFSCPSSGLSSVGNDLVNMMRKNGMKMKKMVASAICVAAWVSFAASVAAFTVDGVRPYTVDL